MPRGIPRRLSQPSVELRSASEIAASQPMQTNESVAKPAKRRRRASVGGYALRLDAPQRNGMVRRWFNDTDNRIADAQDLAYDFVTEQGIKSDSPDTRVRRLVGTKKSGEPMYAYLMETPSEEFEAGVAEKEVRNRQIDDAIREGRDATGRLENQYGEGSIKTGR